MDKNLIDKLNDNLVPDHLAYEYAPVGIVFTEQRIVKSCNQMFATMLGYEKSEILEQSFRMFYASHREFEDIRDIGLEPLKKSGIYCDERMVLCKDGSHIWCRFRAQTLTRQEPLEQTVLTFSPISDIVSNISFTSRERQVITYLSRGLTSKAIGLELEISPRTVEDIRGRLLKKLKVKNVAELLAALNQIPNG